MYILTKIHDMVSADRAVIHHDVPRPQSYCVPLNCQSATLSPVTMRSNMIERTFFTSNLFLASELLSAAGPDLEDLTSSLALSLAWADGPKSGMSTSSMVSKKRVVDKRRAWVESGKVINLLHRHDGDETFLSRLSLVCDWTWISNSAVNFVTTHQRTN